MDSLKILIASLGFTEIDITANNQWGLLYCMVVISKQVSVYSLLSYRKVRNQIFHVKSIMRLSWSHSGLN